MKWEEGWWGWSRGDCVRLGEADRNQTSRALKAHEKADLFRWVKWRFIRTKGLKARALEGGCHDPIWIRFGIRVDHTNWCARKGCKSFRETSWEVTEVVQAKDDRLRGHRDVDNLMDPERVWRLKKKNPNSEKQWRTKGKEAPGMTRPLVSQHNGGQWPLRAWEQAKVWGIWAWYLWYSKQADGYTGLVKEMWCTNNHKTRQEVLKALGEMEINVCGVSQR